METVNQLLSEKGAHVETIGGDASVYDGLAVMSEMGIGALVVMESNKPVGLFSERDYARNIVLKGRNSRDTHISEVMSSPVVCAYPDQTVEECMAVMTEKRVRHLPVMQGETLMGIISIGDLVKRIIENQKIVIEQLVNYING